TANQLRQFVKVFLTGSWQMASGQFEKTALEQIGNDPAVFEHELEKAIAYINRLTQAIPVWKEIAELSPGIPGSRVTDFARNWLWLHERRRPRNHCANRA